MHLMDRDDTHDNGPTYDMPTDLVAVLEQKLDQLADLVKDDRMAGVLVQDMLTLLEERS